MSAPQGLHAKRARVALGGSSLPDPQALVSPPTTGLQVGKPRSKKRPGNNEWGWQQFTKVAVPKAAGAAEGEQAGVSMDSDEESAPAPTPASTSSSTTAAAGAAAAAPVVEA